MRGHHSKTSSIQSIVLRPVPNPQNRSIYLGPLHARTHTRHYLMKINCYAMPCCAILWWKTGLLVTDVERSLSIACAPIQRDPLFRNRTQLRTVHFFRPPSAPVHLQYYSVPTNQSPSSSDCPIIVLHRAGRNDAMAMEHFAVSEWAEKKSKK